MSRSRFGLLAILYAMVMAYASTVVGVLGPHYVPIDPTEALHRLIAMPFVEHGSDQRSDWMGNLVMLVPLGFLVAGWLFPAQPDPPRVGPVLQETNGLLSGLAAFCALVLCFALILAVKYAQLFFPPRTVTLNYVVAQSLGAAAGILLFGIMGTQFAEVGRGFARLESLRIILRIYAGLVLVFLLMPLDFALSMNDLTAQLDRLPESFTAISGEGRPFVVRLTVNVASSLAMMPIGALLTLMGGSRPYVGRSTSAAAWIGFCLMAGVYSLTALLISGAPSLPAVGFRTIGVALGAWSMHRLSRHNPDQIRYRLGRLVPWAVPIYLVTLAAVNGLLSFQWITPHEAANDFYDLGLIPLFNYYIVTKPQAAKNIIAHAVMYAPIGVMIWLRARDGGGKATAFTLAALLSALVEAGRFLRPGLVPDINAIPLAGVAAGAAVSMAAVLWQMLESVAVGGIVAESLQVAGGGAMEWRERDTDRRTRRRDRSGGNSNPIGDIEHY